MEVPFHVSVRTQAGREADQAATRRPDGRVTRGKPRLIGVQAGRDQPRPSRPRKSSAHTNSQSATAPALMPNTNTGL